MAAPRPTVSLPETGPAGAVAATTLVVLALGEQFVELLAAGSAYASAWWLLRPVDRH